MAETKNDAFPHGAARFLGQLRRNNRKDWFDVHREEYERLVLEPAKEFVIELGAGLRKLRPKLQVDPRTNYGVKRINRDVRFARDKRPYKDHQTLWWWEGAAKDPAPGYWFDLTPTRVYLGVGWYMIEPAMLQRYRDAVIDDRRGHALDRLVKRSSGRATSSKVRRRNACHADSSPITRGRDISSTRGSTPAPRRSWHDRDSRQSVSRTTAR